MRQGPLRRQFLGAPLALVLAFGCASLRRSFGPGFSDEPGSLAGPCRADRSCSAGTCVTWNGALTKRVYSACLITCREEDERRRTGEIVANSCPSGFECSVYLDDGPPNPVCVRKTD